MPESCGKLVAEVIDGEDGEPNEVKFTTDDVELPEVGDSFSPPDTPEDGSDKPVPYGLLEVAVKSEEIEVIPARRLRVLDELDKLPLGALAYIEVIFH